MQAQNDVERQPFVRKDQTNIDFDEDSTLGPKQTLVVEEKHAATSTMGILMICAGTIMYGILGTLTRLSMLGQESAPYNSNAALGMFVVAIS